MIAVILVACKPEVKIVKINVRDFGIVANSKQSITTTINQLIDYVTNDSRLVYKVIETKSQRVVGHAEINKIDIRNKSARLCRILIADKSDRNKGYGQLVIKRLIKIGFSDLRIFFIKLPVYINSSTV